MRERPTSEDSVMSELIHLCLALCVLRVSGVTVRPVLPLHASRRTSCGATPSTCRRPANPPRWCGNEDCSRKVRRLERLKGAKDESRCAVTDLFSYSNSLCAFSCICPRAAVLL